MEFQNQRNFKKGHGSIEIHHLLHALALAKIASFEPGTRVLDVGTGGGFPGLPLAILFPEVEFTLVDSIAKKIKVVQAISDELELKNVTAFQKRMEEQKGKFDFIVSRAVAPAKEILNWTKHLLSKESKSQLRNGYLFLKGGDLKNEFSGIKGKSTFYKISDIYSESFFETKQIVHLVTKF